MRLSLSWIRCLESQFRRWSGFGGLSRASLLEGQVQGLCKANGGLTNLAKEHVPVANFPTADWYGVIPHKWALRYSQISGATSGIPGNPGS